MAFAWISLLAPLAILVAMVVAFRDGGLRPKTAPRFAERAALVAAGIALLSLVTLFATGGYRSTGGFGWLPIFDAVSMIMLTLVSFVGWVVLRYARTYMDGEAGQGTFTAWLCGTVASVLVLVQAGNLIIFALAWITTSICLDKLLLFYKDRVPAQRAAKKKFIVSRAGDVVLLIAFVILAMGYETLNIGAIIEAAKAGQHIDYIGAAAILLALAAILKSAQFPFHGWLTEVMETPTPVSATLHAGVINAGGFLLIRFADVMMLSQGALALLVMVGGFTALFGGLVMLTQPAVKNSLAWSTVAQMGFMILQCGLALFPLALLHIVAHSLYKAHAFLASGGAVNLVAANRRPGPVAIPNGAAVGKAFLAALGIYAAMSFAFFGFYEKSPQAIALGAILIFGVAYLIAQGLADTAPKTLTQKTAIYAVATSVGYFVLQMVSGYVTADVLPQNPVAGPLEWALIILAVVSFGAVAVAQAMFPLWAYHPAVAGLRVHLSNGLYANAVFDRVISGWAVRKNT